MLVKDIKYHKIMENFNMSKVPKIINRLKYSLKNVEILEDDYLSQDELDKMIEEDEVNSLFADFNINEYKNSREGLKEEAERWVKEARKDAKEWQSCFDKKFRLCERTYYFQGIEFTPDYINELASRNRLLFLLSDKKQEGIIFDNDEIYQLIEAVCDNWSRYYESC